MGAMKERCHMGNKLQKRTMPEVSGTRNSKAFSPTNLWAGQSGVWITTQSRYSLDRPAHDNAWTRSVLFICLNNTYVGFNNAPVCCHSFVCPPLCWVWSTFSGADVFLPLWAMNALHTCTRRCWLVPVCVCEALTSILKHLSDSWDLLIAPSAIITKRVLKTLHFTKDTGRVYGRIPV